MPGLWYALALKLIFLLSKPSLMRSVWTIVLSEHKPKSNPPTRLNGHCAIGHIRAARNMCTSLSLMPGLWYALALKFIFFFCQSPTSCGHFELSRCLNTYLKVTRPPGLICHCVMVHIRAPQNMCTSLSWKPGLWYALALKFIFLSSKPYLMRSVWTIVLSIHMP